jgi:hypothetical protein
MTSQNRQFTITRGPSKFDLMESLFGSKKGRYPKNVEFQLEGVKECLRFFITGLENNDDFDGEEWFFKGRLSLRNEQLTQGFRVTGFFSTKNRGGNLTFTDPTISEWDDQKKERVKVPDFQGSDDLDALIASLRRG